MRRRLHADVAGAPDAAASRRPVRRLESRGPRHLLQTDQEPQQQEAALVGGAAAPHGRHALLMDPGST